MRIKTILFGTSCIFLTACTDTPGLSYNLHIANYSSSSLILNLSDAYNSSCMYNVIPSVLVLSPDVQTVQLITNNEGSPLSGGCANQATSSLQYLDILNDSGVVLSTIKFGMNSISTTCLNYVPEFFDGDYAITGAQKNSDAGYNTSDVYVNICDSTNPPDSRCTNNAVNNAPKC